MKRWAVPIKSENTGVEEFGFWIITALCSCDQNVKWEVEGSHSLAAEKEVEAK